MNPNAKPTFTGCMSARGVVVLLCLAALPAVASAGDDFCQTQYKIGRQVMENRQGGTSLDKMLRINAGMNLTPVEQLLYDRIVMDAYDTPLFQTPSNKDQAIGEYANKIMLGCLKGAAIAAESEK